MTVTQRTEDLDGFQAFFMSRVPSQFMIPKDLYYFIPDYARVEFNKNCQKLTQNQSPTGHAKLAPRPVDAKPAATDNSGKNNSSLPKQYITRANLADTG